MSSSDRKKGEGGGIGRRDVGYVLCIVGLVGLLTMPLWTPYVGQFNWPWIPPPVDEGLQLTGTVNFANHSAVSGTTYSVQFVNKTTRMTSYTGTISGGSFTTSKGPVSGGTFAQYISISGLMLFVQDVVVPKASDYDQDTYFVGEALLYTSTSLTGSNWNVLMTAGSVANSFTGGGSAATTNFTASAGASQTWTFKIENILDYSKLFRQYTDPYDVDENGQLVPVNPAIWIEINTTSGVIKQDTDVLKWSSGSTTHLLIPLEQITCPGTQNQYITPDMTMSIASADTYTMKIYVVDGSSFSYLREAEARVANPYSGETVTTVTIFDAYLIVS